jgi:hypothetical protein
VARQGYTPRKKVATTIGILRQILTPIRGDIRSLRDRAVLLVDFAGALRRSKLAGIRVEQLEQTKRGLRLTVPLTKRSRAAAVMVPCPTEKRSCVRCVPSSPGWSAAGMDRGEHPARVKGLGWHKTFNVLGGYMELDDPFGVIR